MSEQSRREWKIDGEVIEAATDTAELLLDICDEVLGKRKKKPDQTARLVRVARTLAEERDAERAEAERLRAALTYLSEHRWCEMCCGDSGDPRPIVWDGHALRCSHCGTEVP